MNYWPIAFAALIGLILGIIVEWGFTSAISTISNAVKEPAFHRYLRRVAFSLLGAVIGAWAVIAFTLDARLQALEGSLSADDSRYSSLQLWIEDSTRYNRAKASIEGVEPGWLSEHFAQELEREVDEQLRSISDESTLRIRRERILPTWESLVRNAGHCFLATNLVPPSDWQNVARDGTGSALQKQANARGVLLARVNLVDERCPESYADLSGKHEEAGVLTFQLPRAWIEQNDYLDQAVTDLGTDDLVLVDNAILLKTWTSSNDCKMKRSELTVAPRDIAIARHFFRRLLNDAVLDAGRQGDSAEGSELQSLIARCLPSSNTMNGSRVETKGVE